MASKDEFLRDYEKAIRVKNQLQNDMLERDRLADSHESTSRIDSKLRGGIQELAVDVDSLIRIIHGYEVDAARNKITPSEVQRRRKLVNTLEEDLNDIDASLRQKMKSVKADPMINFKRTEEGESSDTHNLTNKDLMLLKQNQLKQQSEMESAIVGTTENLLIAANNIKDETELHHELLDDAEKNVDVQQVRMEKTTDRMLELLKKSADGCMCACIVLLIITLVLIITLA